MAGDEVQVKNKDNGPMPWYRQLLAIKNTLIVILTPLLLLALPIAWPTKVNLFVFRIILLWPSRVNLSSYRLRIVAWVLMT